MPASLSEWIERLGNTILPTMAQTQQQVSQLIDGASTTHVDYQRVIGRDPGFALSLFRCFDKTGNRLQDPPANLAHAIALLGLAPVMNGVKQLPILSDSLDGDARDGLYQCYSRAVHAACYAYHWGQQHRDANPEDLAIAALFYESAEMALWVNAAEEMTKIRSRIRQGLSRDSAALAVLGISVEQISSALAQRWHLPSLVHSALQPFSAFNPRAIGVTLAASVARESALDWGSSETLDLVELLAEYLNDSPDAAAAALHSLSAQAARELHGLPLPVSAYNLLQLQPRPVGEDQKATAGPAVKAADAPTAKPATRQSPRPQAASEPEREVAATSKPAGTRLQDSLARVMRELTQTLGMERVAFAMLSQDTQQLTVRSIAGTDKGDPLCSFQITPQEKDLFSLLLKKPQGLWVKADNRERIQSLLPPQARAIFDRDSFFITSLFIRNRPLGILYADCVEPDQLSEIRFKRFKQLSQRLCNDLTDGK